MNGKQKNELAKTVHPGTGIDCSECSNESQFFAGRKRAILTQFFACHSTEQSVQLLYYPPKWYSHYSISHNFLANVDNSQIKKIPILL